MTAIQPRSRSVEYGAGTRDVLPVVLGAVPFGLLFGALGAQSGIGLLATLLLSLLVYSGTTQLVGLNMLAAATPWPLVSLATVIISSRHVFYSAALTPHVRDLPLRWRAALSYGMTDQIYALAERRYAAPDGSREKHWYVLGSSATLCLAWYASTWAGFAFGDVLRSVKGLGLDFALYATLVALAAPVLDNLRAILAGLAAGGVALILAPLPYQSGLFVAILVGITAGVLTEHVTGARAVSGKRS